MPHTGDEQVRAAAGGHGEALAALLRQYGPQVRRRLHISPVWRAALEPADVMQVTYLEAFLQLDQLHTHTAEAFVAWLTQLAQNNLRDAIRELERARRPDPRRQLRDAAAQDSSAATPYDVPRTRVQTPSRDAARREIPAVLEAALAQLPCSYAEVVRRHDLDGRSIADVAAALDRSPGSVYLLRLRALARLRELLGSESNFFSDGA